MNTIDQVVARLMAGIGIEQIHIHTWSIRIASLLGIIVISYLTTKLFHHIVIPTIQKITRRTKATWDDYVFNEQMLTAFCRLIPPLMWYILLPFVLEDEPELLDILLRACLVYLIIVVLRLVSTFMNILYEISNEHERLRNRPLKGIYQMLNLVAIGVGLILIISILINQNATSILAGLGASAAILMLVFKDSILGLVAGIQLSANDMLRPGDWITMPKYGADGYVIEVSLTTVKVQNFDKTITTVPPYALVSDSFQNWRGMRESGGRRIKRSLLIDVRSIHACSPEEIEQYKAKNLWAFEEKENELPAKQPLINLEAFRRHALAYLRQREELNQEMPLMIRQLQPTSEGLPLEIYCFTTVKDWIPYEDIQTSIFNHLIGVLPEFSLRLYQKPAELIYKDADDADKSLIKN